MKYRRDNIDEEKMSEIVSSHRKIAVKMFEEK